MARILLALVSLAAATYGIFWITNSPPGEMKARVEGLLHTGSFHTLEIRYTAEQIMETNRKNLLKDARHKYLEPSLNFYPYLLFEVKYAISDTKTREGVMLWDLTDGEMVLDTKHWDKTHGFSDCIKASANRQEFRIINALASKGGSSDRKSLIEFLRVDHDVLDSWIESCRRKKLVVQTGNRYRLHLEKPKLKTLPFTQLEEGLVTKPHSQAVRLSRHFSPSQIEKTTRAAFGSDFAIRRTMDVFLPVHCIVVQNPDGSIHTSHWNALNGERLESLATGR